MKHEVQAAVPVIPEKLLYMNGCVTCVVSAHHAWAAASIIIMVDKNVDW